MRSINLGIRVRQGTTLTVTLAAADASAEVRIARGANPFKPVTPRADGRSYEVSQLTAGDYVLVVDCIVRPVQIETSADAAFWSIDATQDPPPWKLGFGRAVKNEDPKNPWPIPLAMPTGLPPDAYLAAFLTSNSAITDRMRQLLDANAGKGADPAPAQPATHALLIGIDRYNDGAGQDGAIYRNLRGCVHDVLEVETLLRAQIPGIQVTLMIAPRPEGPGSDRVIPADCIPTYTNIVTQWRRMADTAQPGDIIYIHYSGHGGRAKTVFPAYKPAGLDESLAPCDINDRGRGRYLRDVEVATLLQRMARRELVTTVVLDSCHSGDATRGDQVQARRGECDEIESRGLDTLPSEAGTAEELEAVARDLASNPLGTAAAWRIDPEFGRTSFTTVLAACRGHEAAYEFSPDPDTRCGALTHFWLKAMAQRPRHATYRRLYDQVYGDVRGRFASQTPMLLGEENRLVLGTGIVAEPPSVPVRNVAGDEVTLGAGAPILSKGMHLAIVPPGGVPELEELSSLAEVEITRILDEATALARRVPGTGLDADGHELPIAVGGQGIVRSYPPRMQRSVRLPAQDVPAEVLDRVTAKVAADVRKLVAVTNTDAADYQVFVDEWPEHSGVPCYRICDPAGMRLPYVPPVAIKGEDAAGKVVDQLVHLARYGNVRLLANGDPGAPLTGKLEIEVLALSDYDPAESGPLAPVPLPPGPVQIQHGAYFCLRVRSRSAQYLHLAIIDLQANWSIDTLVPGISELPPFGIREIALRAELPDQDARTATEVVKVLATREPINPELLTLPPLGATYVPKAERKTGEPALLELFRILQEPLTEQRKVALAAAPSSNWIIAQTEIEIIAR